MTTTRILPDAPSKEQAVPFNWERRSGTLMYAPDVAIYVATDTAGILDLSKDIVDGSITRRVNALSTLTANVTNKWGKYDRVIGRMSRIVCFLKRLNWLQVFAGYVTQAPYETVVPGTSQISAVCTLKRLLHTYWDPYSGEAQQFFPAAHQPASWQSADGGSAASAFKIMTTVAHWDKSQILIQKIPEAFLKQAVELANKGQSDLDPLVLQGLQMILDSEGWMGGVGGSVSSPSAGGAPVDPVTGAQHGRGTKWTGGGAATDAHWEDVYGPGAPQNGQVPLSALTRVQGVNGWSYWLRSDVAAGYNQARKAAPHGSLLCSSAYRDLSTQQGLYNARFSNPYPVAKPGTSNHGGATAIDVSTHDPDYVWFTQHCQQYGFLHDVSGDAVHFDWFQDPNGGGGNDPTSVSGSTSSGGGPLDSGGVISQTPFNVFQFYPQYSAESDLFTGDRAWINDVAVLQSIQYLMQASLRDFQSSPTGDFIAWYPDKFGIYGKSPAVKVRDIEITKFNIDITDDPLTTHVAVAGDFGQDPVSGLNPEWMMTSGVVSVDNEAVMKMLLGLDPKRSYKNLDGAWIKQRFGIRPLRQDVAFIRDHVWEFMIALHLFAQKWTEQFLTQVEFTFLPEIYPGMRIEIVEHDLAVYVEEVTHNFSRQGGFATTAQISSPMQRDGKGGWRLMDIERTPIPISDQDAFVNQDPLQVPIPNFIHKPPLQ